MTLKNNIRKLRFEHGEMTQAELAKAVGVSRQTILSMEKHRYTPSVRLALKIAKFFKVPLEKCFYLEHESTYPTKNQDIIRGYHHRTNLTNTKRIF